MAQKYLIQLFNDLLLISIILTRELQFPKWCQKEVSVKNIKTITLKACRKLNLIKFAACNERLTLLNDIVYNYHLGSTTIITWLFFSCHSIFQFSNYFRKTFRK